MQSEIQQGLESLDIQIVSTVQEQTKTLEDRLKQVEARVDHSTKTTREYQKLLADSLQTNICAALEQLGKMRTSGGLTRPHCPAGTGH